MTQTKHTIFIFIVNSDMLLKNGHMSSAMWQENEIKKKTTAT